VKAVTPQLVLFARYPTPGECKTRLIPAIGAQGAADLHRHLTERTVKQLCASGAPVSVATTGAQLAEFEAWLGPQVHFTEQVEGGLTERLFAFLDRAPVIFFGADTPDLGAGHVRAAIEGLATHEVVIGPATDGGYYLIGMRAPYPELLTDMPWSTDQVLPETVRRLDGLGIEPLLLEPLSDCDRPEDLKLWPNLAAKQDALVGQSVGK
jgi:rSAM/selenodomain-associated transferase 1